MTARADDVPPVKLTIHPMAAPRPSLKYQLLPPFATRIRGNAAVYYGKVTAERIAFFSNRELIEKIDSWRELPLSELRKPEIKTQTETIEDMLARAARCDSCDWQLPIREEDYFNILLPEVQQTRQFARFLATSARIHIARGEFEVALQKFQSAFALARNVAKGETLINGLVGIAICGIMMPQVQAFVEQPAAPNLYWALTTLPQPLVDLRAGVEGEMLGETTCLPEVGNLNADRTPDQWRQLLSQFWQRVAKAAQNENQQIEPADALLENSLRGYPESKQAMIARGMPVETVDAMPAAQVVYLDIVRSFEEARDDRFEWLYVPYWQGVDRLKIDEAAAADDAGAAALPVKLLMPAVSAAHHATARIEREFALLRVVEALRLHGATSGGRLPEHLADVTVVPLPDDPVTGKEFVYRLEDTTAVIELTPMLGRPTRWEIKMER
ncbi:MAG TPA: hypothetical protein VHD36_13750 [Pirellulales bacterium]|nr:hypothetical protein [Pirellulales bacterium]